ncbi:MULTISPECIES: hypothetical protein [unclassified Prochlorococcus]|uniref:hypothetical protein n=1 Tax=unclassified Prochlorococcus TaxID=2627481 RepID=UPI000533B222|nr:MULTISPECIES: hypothetical protein [unclassified Prochlorococcus]KGG26964.1 hypothetical protein EV13_2267 [Prochlorococcus sp. MIT 0702]KGG27192.1 hypothetical protein EV12_1331 [Prochlorococcus sp. MIT 0701]KGG33110.1 hypothetical protein EV14_1758 [Prochlorococcus sp. MIT 0703]
MGNPQKERTELMGIQVGRDHVMMSHTFNQLKTETKADASVNDNFDLLTEAFLEADKANAELTAIYLGKLEEKINRNTELIGQIVKRLDQSSS